MCNGASQTTRKKSQKEPGKKARKNTAPNSMQSDKCITTTVPVGQGRYMGAKLLLFLEK
jgi:hypothetical protein